MSVFCYKPIKQPERLGELFRRTREFRGWDIKKIERDGHIPPKYVHALESGRFDVLPHAKAHRLAYVRHYASVLNLNSDECTEQFCRENGLVGTKPATHLSAEHCAKNGHSISIIVRNTVLAACVSLFISYLVWQVKGIIEPPRLTVISPIDGSVVNERTILVQGEAETGSRLMVNGQEVAGDSHGQFRLPIDIAEGLNTLRITATKKHGKTTEYTINVILKSPVFGTE